MFLGIVWVELISWKGIVFVFKKKRLINIGVLRENILYLKCKIYSIDIIYKR